MRTGITLAILGATTTTCLARNILTNLYFLLATTINFLKSKLDFNTKIGATENTTCCTAITSKTSETRSETTATEQVTEDAAKLGEDIIHIHTTLSIGTINTGMSELVISSFLFRIAQHIISLGSLLELFLGLFVSRVPVGMVLKSQLAVGFLQFICCSVFINAQHFIIVSLCHFLFLLSQQATTTLA